MGRQRIAKAIRIAASTSSKSRSDVQNRTEHHTVSNNKKVNVVSLDAAARTPR